MREMTLKKAPVLSLALLLVSALTIGCGARSSLRIGWLESGGPRHKTARYRTFSGVERASFRVEEGQTVEIDYEINVEKGTLTLSVTDPDGEIVWEETFEEAVGDGGEPELSFRGEHALEPVAQTGRYKLRIEGDRTGGSFDLSWEVRQPHS